MNMEHTSEKILELTDLPNFKVIFAEPLAEFGVTTIDELLLVLKDDARKDSMIAAVKGLGPRTVQSWENALACLENPVDSVAPESDAIPPVEEFENATSDKTQEIAVETKMEQPEEGTESVPVEPEAARNLFCSMDEFRNIQRTTVDLLRMNGAKKKGQSASVEYVKKRLTEAGLEVTVDEESGFPAIIATKGEGGVVLWGHLDTERRNGMKKKEQGDILGNMIHGRGAANMKGAVASMVCAADRLSTWDVPFSIVLTTDALNEQIAAESISRNQLIQNSKGILILGPTGMRPIIGLPGYAAIKISISGEGSVMKMAAFLERLYEKTEDSSGRFSLKTGLIQGGNKKRPYDSPNSCEITIELETTDATDLAIKMLDDLLAEEEHKIEVICQSEMAEFDVTGELIMAMTESTKKEPLVELTHSEAAKIVPANNRIVIYGPGTMASAVSDQEYVTINELERTYEVILDVVDQLNALDD
jgi:acetylornithine deacetylase/succinyl-diaminopimelate desuccinylase-like protein